MIFKVPTSLYGDADMGDKTSQLTTKFKALVCGQQFIKNSSSSEARFVLLIMLSWRTNKSQPLSRPF